MPKYQLKLENAWSAKDPHTINDDYRFLPPAIRKQLSLLAENYNSVHNFNVGEDYFIDLRHFENTFGDWCSLTIGYYHDTFELSKKIEHQLQNALDNKPPRRMFAYTSSQKTLIIGLRNTLIRTRAVYLASIPRALADLRRKAVMDAGLLRRT
ncbi:MAG TPA: hypothetical protein HPQ04_08815 [Rhodospirillaceae bacterium]|nr:hypothetical protein [Rhodospirillaceae bacterium]